VTCSGLAVHRELLREEAGAGFETLVMEEAGKILETEALIALPGTSRVVLIGDDKQLEAVGMLHIVRVTVTYAVMVLVAFSADSILTLHCSGGAGPAPVLQFPAVTSQALAAPRYPPPRKEKKKKPHLLTRATSGVVPVLLNQQGRAVPELADLYRWRYGSGLQDLPGGGPTPLPLPVLRTNLQWIDTDTLASMPALSQRETDMDEAAHVAAFVCFLVRYHHLSPLCASWWRRTELPGGRFARLEAARIAVLTPYRAQKALLEQRLEATGVRARTTDEFQGNQADYVVLSLVLSGDAPSPHLRDKVSPLSCSLGLRACCCCCCAC
jgi:hypothetical protein